MLLPLAHFFSRPLQASLVQLAIKLVRVRPFGISEQHTPTRGKVAGEKSDERRKCRSVVENLSPKDQGKPSIAYVSGKVERPGFKKRAAVYLRVDRGKGERIRLLIGEHHLAALEGGDNAS